MDWVIDRQDDRTHFASCDYICKSMAAHPDFRFPCTCGTVYREMQQRMHDHEQAQAFLAQHPEFGVRRTDVHAIRA